MSARLPTPRSTKSSGVVGRHDTPEFRSMGMWMGHDGLTDRFRSSTRATREPWRMCGGAVRCRRRRGGAVRRGGDAVDRAAAEPAAAGVRELAAMVGGAARRCARDHRHHQPGIGRKGAEKMVAPAGTWRTGRFHRRWMLNLRPTWRKCWRGTRGRMMARTPWCAWTSNRCSWSRRPARVCRHPEPSVTDELRVRAGGNGSGVHVLRRWATACKRRTKTDWAHEAADLLEGRDVDCERVTLVVDNVSSHTERAGCGASGLMADEDRRCSVQAQVRLPETHAVTDR